MKPYSALILFTLLLSSCITEENPLQTESEIPEIAIPDSPFGIHTTSQLYPYLPRLGASWTFVGLLWKEVEPEQDVWNFETADSIIQEARNNNITLIVKIRTGTCWATKEKSPSETSSPPERLEDYSQFVSTVVSRYHNDVQYWAIENEMNTHRFWTGTLEEYNQVLETAYITIKEVDPNAQVLDSGFASMTYGICITRDLYEQGKVEEAITFFNEYYKRRLITISSETELQEAVYTEDAQRTYTMMVDHFENLYYDVYQLHYYEEYTLLDDVIHFIKDHLKKERQIFAVEMGYAYQDDATYDEQTHAEEMVKLMVSLQKEAIPVQIYLPLIDLDADGAEQWRGLVSPERERRPALTSYVVTTRLLKDKEFTKNGDSSIVWYEFEDVSVLWSEHVTTVDLPERVMIIDINGGRTVTGHSLEVGPSPLFMVKRESANYETAENTEIAGNTEIVEFPSYDGVIVRGFLVRPPENNTVYPAVVLVHGGRSSQQAAHQMAETIGALYVDHEYVALSVDYRDGPLGLQDVEDTRAAIAFLKTLDFVDRERIGVYGGSHGGYIALMCAWRSDVKAVVEAAGFCDLKEMTEQILQSGDEKSQWMKQMVEFYGGYPDEVPDAYMEYSPCGHIAEFTAPVFIIHGKMDTTVPVEHAYTLQELLDYHNTPYEIYLSEEGAHGFYHARTAEAAKVWELIFDFFDKYLKS